MLYLKDIFNFSSQEVGNKAYNLGLLLNKKFNIANGFVITADEFFDFHKLQKVDCQAATKKLYDKLQNFLRPSDQVKAYIVRSSGTAEDSKNSSCAGYYESVVCVNEISALVHGIRYCWQHYENFEATTSIAALPLLIQEQIECAVSGVMFNINPVTKSYDQFLIESTYGSCESVVSGTFPVDRYVVNKLTKEIKVELGEKKNYLDIDSASQDYTKEVQTPINMVKAHSLSYKQIMQLLLLAEKIYKKYKFPQDIEWGIEKVTGKIFIFQTRPITNLHS